MEPYPPQKEVAKLSMERGDPGDAEIAEYLIWEPLINSIIPLSRWRERGWGRGRCGDNSDIPGNFPSPSPASGSGDSLFECRINQSFLSWISRFIPAASSASQETGPVTPFPYLPFHFGSLIWGRLGCRFRTSCRPAWRPGRGSCIRNSCPRPSQLLRRRPERSRARWCLLS